MPSIITDIYVEMNEWYEALIAAIVFAVISYACFEAAHWLFYKGGFLVVPAFFSLVVCLYAFVGVLYGIFLTILMVLP